MRALVEVTLGVLLLAATAFAEDLKSGLQPGELVGTFDVEKCGGAVNDGNDVGANFCPLCALGRRPVVMVFARKADPSLAKLVKELDKAIEANSSKKLSSVVNLIGKDPADLKVQAKKFAAQNMVENVALVVPDDNENGPPEFNISPEAEVTVILYREGKVEANHALPAGKLDKQSIQSILADTSKILK